MPPAPSPSGRRLATCGLMIATALCGAGQGRGLEGHVGSENADQDVRHGLAELGLLTEDLIVIGQVDVDFRAGACDDGEALSSLGRILPER